MSTGYVITHPEVVIDPAVPVPRWHLSDRGIQRMRAFAATAPVSRLAAVWASSETKAIEAAGILAGRAGLSVQVHPGLGENDRSATGFLPPPEFERMADAFFASPSRSIDGWERAVDAQTRIAAAVDDILRDPPEGDVAFVTHGGVGTLLLCRYLGVAITRAHDQAFQGQYWAFDIGSRRVLHTWRPIAPREVGDQA